MQKGRAMLNILLSLVMISSGLSSFIVESNSVSANVNAVNLALNKPVSVSSALPQHPGSNMTDGSNGGMWSTSDTGWQSNVITDEWATVDLGTAVQIGRWVVQHAASGNLTTRDFKLEYSTADQNGPWVTADDVIGNTVTVTDRVLASPVQARYVRLHITKKAEEGSDWPAVRINELELYAPATTATDLTATPPPGIVANGSQVQLNSSNAAANIYYTTDGSDPVSSPSRQLYGGLLTISGNTTIKAVAIDGAGSMSEIQVLAYLISNVNLALNKPVTVSSALPQHPGSYMTDGSNGGMWSTSDTGWRSSPYADEWAVVDLGAEHDIVRWIVEHGATGNMTTRDFKLEFSTGDQNGPWQTADDVIGNTDGITDRLLATAVRARYVRLHVTKKAEEGSDWPAVRINELKLYSAAAIDPDLKATPEPGTIPKGRLVTLSSTHTNAKIYYTVDGGDPLGSTNRFLYAEPLAINADVTLKAVAVDEVGGGHSEVRTLTYTLLPDDLTMFPNLARSATATMTVPAGWGNVASRAIDGDNTTYAQPEQAGPWDLIVDLGESKPVNYAVLRKNPNHQNYIPKFTIDVSDNGTDWTTVVTENDNSDLFDQYYLFPVQTKRYVRLHQVSIVGLAAAVWEFELYDTSKSQPVRADLSDLTVAEGTMVGLMSQEPNVTIYYTTDGSDPVTSGTRVLYSGRITLAGETVDSAVTIKAYATSVGKTDSVVSTFAYRVIAISANPAAGIVNANTDVALSSSIAGAYLSRASRM